MIAVSFRIQQQHSTFTARKLPVEANGVFTGFSPHVTSLTDYYPFGSGMEGRTVDGSYRYGFQAQETDAEYFNGVVSFKYRVHDVRLGRFLSIDPLAPDYPWNSTYAFSENRVIDGVELEGLEFSEAGKEAMKYVSPIVIAPTFKAGTHGWSIGLEISYGIPKMFPIAARKEYSISSTSGLQGDTQIHKTDATEVSIGYGLLSWKQTEHDSGPTSQTTGEITLGSPFFNVRSSNDVAFMGGDGGDRFRTADGSVTMGFLEMGFKLQTEDPGLDERPKKEGGPNRTYDTTPQAGDRQGIVYLGIGPLKIGRDSDRIRDFIQNTVIHDNIGSPRFENTETPSRNYVEITNE